MSRAPLLMKKSAVPVHRVGASQACHRTGDTRVPLTEAGFAAERAFLGFAEPTAEQGRRGGSRGHLPPAGAPTPPQPRARRCPAASQPQFPRPTNRVKTGTCRFRAAVRGTANPKSHRCVAQPL